MYRVATEQDKRAIYELYRKSAIVSTDNFDDYFACNFVAENTIVNEINGHVAASIQVNYYPILLYGKKVMTSYLFGRFTDKSKSTKYLNELTKQVIDYQNYKTLISIIPVENMNEFSKYNFDSVYKRRLYTINRSDLENASYQGVSIDITIEELMDLYNRFVSNFNGYFIRDRKYWVNLFELLKFKHYNIAIYHNEDGKAQGYMIYTIEPSKVVIKELIYDNGAALTRLLCYGLRNKRTVQVYVSQNENLERAFPNIKYKLVTCFVARINDFELFNELYQCNVSETMKGFYLNEIPLFISQEIM